MAILRSSPYIWVTWLAPYLVGEKSCEWAAWFRAQHQSGTWNKAPSDFNTVNWLEEHTELLNRWGNCYRGKNMTVSIENQNSFCLKGKTAKLAGKPDLIVKPRKSVSLPGQTQQDVRATLPARLNNVTGTIIDVKTGKPKQAHVEQVKIYMWAVPLALNAHKGALFDGRVIYRDQECK